jgi:simple sugar transport system permease protein
MDANNIGLFYELDAILAVVIGGTPMAGGRFSLFASVISALVIWTFTIVMGGTLLTGGVGNIIRTLFGVLINGGIVSIQQFNGTLSS